MADKTPRFEKLANPRIWIPVAAVAILAAALFWYPPLYQPGYAPADDAPFFEAGQAGVNINTANEAELLALPGIGEKRAKAIIAYREENGPFSCTQDIVEVNGIGPKIFEDICDLITV